METSEKPKIESKKAVIPCHRYGELIKSKNKFEEENLKLKI